MDPARKCSLSNTAVRFRGGAWKREKGKWKSAWGRLFSFRRRCGTRCTEADASAEGLDLELGASAAERVGLATARAGLAARWPRDLQRRSEVALVGADDERRVGGLGHRRDDVA